jgi:hypothetical protein
MKASNARHVSAKDTSLACPMLIAEHPARSPPRTGVLEQRSSITPQRVRRIRRRDSDARHASVRRHQGQHAVSH